MLKTNWLTFEEVQGFKRFAKFWDLLASQGKFPATMRAIVAASAASESGSLFCLFWELSEFLGRRHPKLHSIGLPSLTESIQEFFGAEIRGAIEADIAFRLRTVRAKNPATPKRQELHRRAVSKNGNDLGEFSEGLHEKNRKQLGGGTSGDSVSM